MSRRSPRHAANISGANADSAAETSLAETQPSEVSFRTEEGTGLESTQGESAASTGTPRRNPMRRVRQLEEENGMMNEPLVSYSNESVNSEPGFSVFSTMRSIALETPAGVPESVYRDPDWKHWLEHRRSFLEQYGSLGPLLHDLASGPGPTWVRTHPDRWVPVNNPSQVGTVRRSNEALRTAEEALAGMVMCCASIKNSAIQAHMTRKAQGLKIMLKNLYDQEFIPLARMKGFKIVDPSTAGPAGQNLRGEDHQIGPEGGQPDDKSDAAISDGEDPDEEMSTA
jgi:hypothetical protein